MKKIKGKSLIFLGDKDKSIDVYQLTNGEYVCVITEGIRGEVATELTISDSHIDVFIDKLKDYPKAVELACEVFFAELMEEPTDYGRFVWECLKRIYERSLNTINIEINKEERNEQQFFIRN